MFGQPKDYSEMLKRIFYASLAVGITCTLILGSISSEIKEIINLSSKEWDLGFSTLPIIAVLIPFCIAVISRIITLHDKVSDIFKIRAKFDVNYILIPLFEGVGVAINDELKKTIRKQRHSLMRRIFYKYAPNVENASINKQLISTAFDRWGWFWCFIEPTVIIFFSAFLAWYFGGFKNSLFFFIVTVLFILIAVLIYPSLRRVAKHQVDDILSNSDRINEILNEIQN